MRLFIILIFLAFCAECAFAQPTIIPRMGATFSRVNGESAIEADQKTLTGFTMGIGFQFPVGKVFIQPELNYVQKGFGFTASETDQGFSIAVENKTRIDYLEVPILMKFYIAPSRVYFLLGPSVAVGIGGQSKSKVETDLFGTPFSFSVKGNVKFGDPPPSYNPEEDTEVYFDNRLDAGLQGALGVVVYKQVTIEIRYNYGLSNLQNDDDSKNRVIHLNMAVPLRLRAIKTK